MPPLRPSPQPPHRPLRFALRSSGRVCLGISLAGMLLSGCQPALPSSSEASLPELLSASLPVRPPPADSFIECEPNDTFAAADPVAALTAVDLHGMVAGGVADVDVFDLGPFGADERVRVALDDDADRGLRVGVFDDQERLLGCFEPGAAARAFTVTLREESDALHVVVTAGDTDAAERAYTVTVTLDGFVSAPEAAKQVVVLNFEGNKSVRIGRRAPVDVPAFDSAALGTAFAGQTDWFIERIRDLVEADYAGLNVAFHLAGDPPIPSGEVTTVYFGTSDEALLGVADAIDAGNAQVDQKALLFTDVFALFNALSPSAEQMAQAVANVTSHELGHLLGLQHTVGARSIMDVTGTAGDLMRDRWFSIAPLHPEVFAIGSQDAPSTLSWTLGGTLSLDVTSKGAVARKSALYGADSADVPIDLESFAVRSAED